jgi:hypothetical protein
MVHEVFGLNSTSSFTPILHFSFVRWASRREPARKRRMLWRQVIIKLARVLTTGV